MDLTPFLLIFDRYTSKSISVESKIFLKSFAILSAFFFPVVSAKKEGPDPEIPPPQSVSI